MSATIILHPRSRLSAVAVTLWDRGYELTRMRGKRTLIVAQPRVPVLRDEVKGKYFRFLEQRT